MKKKKDKNYPWEFSIVGGVVRVAIRNGEDIAHLPELDQKLWTVLSCPTSGFEFDETTLNLMDANQDGKIHVNDVTAAATWLTKVLRKPNDLLKGESSIHLSGFADTPEGQEVLNACRAVLAKTGESDKEVICLEDAAKALGILAKESAAIRQAEEKVLPYGEDTQAALVAVNTLKAKIDDYFLRCRLAAFDAESTATLDVSTKRIEAISERNLPDCMDEIAAYPLFRINGGSTMPLGGGVNPAWRDAFNSLKSLVFDKDFPDADSISETDWNDIQNKFAEYLKWKETVEKETAEFLESQKVEADTFTLADKFLHLYRDFYKLLNNFVTLKDFYSRDPQNLAVFQAGKLFIDQRCLELCIRVSDMGKQIAVASKSNMFILYCDCVSKQGGRMTIAAAVTDSEVSNLHEGQNAIFYDRNGLDWDATVIKIVENPVSVPQSFWRPYRKFAKWCSEKLNSKVAAKDDALLNMAGEVEADPAKAAPQAFDIAKFAGIFAAIGMALGFILDALVGVMDSLAKMPWYGVILVFAALILVISAPSMILTWIKLRKRSLSPILNANGWAINSRILVNSRFGMTLTSVAKRPKVVIGKDPYSEEQPLWKKILGWFIFIAVVAGIAFGILYHQDKLHFLGIENPKATAVCSEAPAE